MILVSSGMDDFVSGGRVTAGNLPSPSRTWMNPFPQGRPRVCVQGPLVPVTWVVWAGGTPPPSPPVHLAQLVLGPLAAVFACLDNGGGADPGIAGRAQRLLGGGIPNIAAWLEEGFPNRCVLGGAPAEPCWLEQQRSVVPMMSPEAWPSFLSITRVLRLWPWV